MRSGACRHSTSASAGSHSPRPASRVSARCSSQVSGSCSARAAATVIWAITVAPPRPTMFLSARMTAAPVRAAAKAAYMPAPPAPTTRTSVERRILLLKSECVACIVLGARSRAGDARPTGRTGRPRRIPTPRRGSGVVYRRATACDVMPPRTPGAAATSGLPSTRIMSSGVRLIYYRRYQSLRLMGRSVR